LRVKGAAVVLADFNAEKAEAEAAALRADGLRGARPWPLM
jgi:hypothetical protein